MTALFLKLVDIRFELVIGYNLKTSGSINIAKKYYKMIEFRKLNTEIINAFYKR